jgi:hypothetical protein
MSTDGNTFRRGEWQDGQWQPSDDDDADGLPVGPRGAGIPEGHLKLLELAARAIGAIRIEVVEGENWVNLHFADGSVVYGWNSIMHSDDMLNLSARLRIDIEWEGEAAVFADGNWSELVGDDPAAAARLAVTRAAAEIELMKAL